MNARWNLVLLPSAIVSLLLLFGTQFVFLRAGFYEDLGLGLIGDQVQLDNYVMAFQDSFYLDALWLTMYLSAIVVVCSLPVHRSVQPEARGEDHHPRYQREHRAHFHRGVRGRKGGDENNIDPGLELIRDIGVFSFWNSGTQVTQMFKSGDVLVAIAHAGWGVRLHDAGVPVGMIHPMVKDRVGLASRGYAGVVKGTKHKAAAEFYINELVSEGMQEILHTKNGIVPTNRKVQVKYSGEPKLDSTGVPFLMLSPDQIANLYYMDWSGFSMKDWTRKWNRIVASQ